MTNAAPDAAALVAQFASAPRRVETLFRLNEIGDAALPAVRAGLQHSDWHIRQWCAIFLDRGGTADALADLVPLLHDPEPRVRLWAIHSLACEHCKPGACTIDVVPMLLERLEHDAHTRVRKMAAAMLSLVPPDARVPPVLDAALPRETDRRLRLHIERALSKHRS